MLFPYREGLSFEQDVWMDQGQTAAFAGALDHPPTSSWEIINPREYEKKHIPPIPLLPNIHPLLDAAYKPYDIGQVGQLDVHILSELLGGDNAARDLTPAWNGGLYWAGQLRSATTPAQQADTASIGLFYFSVWKNAESAQVFAKIYSNNSRPQVFPCERALPPAHLQPATAPSNTSSPPMKALSSSPFAAKWSSSQRVSRYRWRASSPRSSSTRRAEGRCTWRVRRLILARPLSRPMRPAGHSLPI